MSIDRPRWTWQGSASLCNSRPPKAASFRGRAVFFSSRVGSTSSARASLRSQAPSTSSHIRSYLYQHANSHTPYLRIGASWPCRARTAGWLHMLLLARCWRRRRMQ
eukprot:5052999-Pyramimonas_sp.AAC.2